MPNSDAPRKRIKKRELLNKSREAMLSAVTIYNNPQISFKSESFITLSVVAWTYLLHTYYANIGIDYRYYSIKGNSRRKYYDRTKYGAYKHWELERCLNEKKCPLDPDTKNNLRFLIGIRHEIEHQMTKKIDDSISAKIQACSINYNFYIKKLFGDALGVDQDLGLSIQFSPLLEEQKNQLLHNEQVASNVRGFITAFEDTLTADELGNTHYAYRVVFTRVDGKRKNSFTDEVISFLSADDPMAKNIKAEYAIIKETEKKKYLSNEIVQMMKEQGFAWFTVNVMTGFWKNELGSRDQYGIYVTRSQWMWYENWIPVIERFCKEEDDRRKKNENVAFKPGKIVQMIKDKGYLNFSIYWLNIAIKNSGIDRNDDRYAAKDKYGQILWKKEILPIIEKFCEEHKSRFVYGK